MDFEGALPWQTEEISNEIKAHTGISGPKLSKNGLGVDLGKIYFLTFTHNFQFFFQNFENCYDHPGGEGGGQGVPIGIVEKLVISSLNSIHTSL